MSVSDFTNHRISLRAFQNDPEGARAGRPGSCAYRTGLVVEVDRAWDTYQMMHADLVVDTEATVLKDRYGRGGIRSGYAMILAHVLPDPPQRFDPGIRERTRAEKAAYIEGYTEGGQAALCEINRQVKRFALPPQARVFKPAMAAAVKTLNATLDAVRGTL